MATALVLEFLPKVCSSRRNNVECVEVGDQGWKLSGLEENDHLIGRGRRKASRKKWVLSNV